MLKTEYLGYRLQGLRLLEADVCRETDEWRACYLDKVVSGWTGQEVHGHGHTPEAAMADAQKQIKLASKE